MKVNYKIEHVLQEKTPLHPSMSRGTTMFQVCFFRSSCCFSSVKIFIISYCQRAAQREMRKERLFRSHMNAPGRLHAKKKDRKSFRTKESNRKKWKWRKRRKNQPMIRKTPGKAFQLRQKKRKSSWNWIFFFLSVDWNLCVSSLVEFKKAREKLWRMFAQNI